jgi:hypothetical protein
VDPPKELPRVERTLSELLDEEAREAVEREAEEIDPGVLCGGRHRPRL